MSDEHEYPSGCAPGTHWATNAAWEILDSIKPGVISLDVRFYLAGQIAALLMSYSSDGKLAYAGSDEHAALKAENEKLRQELAIILDTFDAAVWRERDGERAKHIWFAPTAIERIRSLLAR